MRIISQNGLLTYDWDDVEELIAYSNSEAVGYALLGHRDKWVIVVGTEGETSLMGEYSLKSQVDDVLEMLKEKVNSGKCDGVFRFPKEEEIPFK